MKLHIDLPWGGAFDLERQPMEPAKFYALCALAAGALLVALLLGGIALR